MRHCKSDKKKNVRISVSILFFFFFLDFSSYSYTVSLIYSCHLLSHHLRALSHFGATIRQVAHPCPPLDSQQRDVSRQLTIVTQRRTFSLFDSFCPRAECADDQNAVALGHTPCRCSSLAEVWFYRIQINILVHLSIIYQHYSVKGFFMDLQ